VSRALLTALSPVHHCSALMWMGDSGAVTWFFAAAGAIYELLALGLGGRAMTIAAFAVHLSIVERSGPFVTGPDQIEASPPCRMRKLTRRATTLTGSPSAPTPRRPLAVYPFST
jgi:hypothetical protein